MPSWMKRFLFWSLFFVAAMTFGLLTGTRGRWHTDAVPWSKVRDMLPFLSIFGIGWGSYMAIRPWLVSKLRPKKHDLLK